MIKHGLFISIFDTQTITTTATLDTETGRLYNWFAVSDSRWHLLKSEKFIADDGEEFDVCPTCHVHVLKEKDITDTDEDGNELPEIAGIIICSNPYCDSNLIST